MPFLMALNFRAKRLIGAIRSRLYRWKACCQCSLHNGKVEWPGSSKADVPVRCDGQGTVTIGARVCLGYFPAPRIGTGEILLQARGAGSSIAIGAGTATSNNISFVAMKRVEIGECCQIGDLVSIFDCDFHEISPATRNRTAGKISPVSIGNNVWLGSRVMVLKGVTIGDNSVIAASSVVTKPIPANCIAAGNPARVIRSID